MKLKKEDIEFTCIKCGECCRVDGYVYLKRGETEKMARYLEIPVKEFRKKYTRLLFLLGRVIETDAQGCAFLIDGRCIIYPARPSQCVTFPYWKRIMNDSKEWKYISAYCPGAARAKIKGRDDK
jgi:Fe-S-cluster containining protein